MKTLIKILLIFFSTGALAQDVLVKNDKTELKVKVLELTDDVIKYKKFEMQDGPTYNINKSDVFMIIYKNGTKEYVEIAKKATPAPAIVQQPAAALQNANTNSVTAIKAPTTSQNTDFLYDPSRLFVNFIEGYTLSLTTMQDYSNNKAAASNASIFSHLNFGILLNASIYDDGYTNLTTYDLGLYTNLYFPVNKLSGAQNINTGLFPFIYGGALLRYSTAEAGGYSEDNFTGDFLLGFGLDYKFSKGFGLTARYDVDYKFGVGVNFKF